MKRKLFVFILLLVFCLCVVYLMSLHANVKMRTTKRGMGQKCGYSDCDKNGLNSESKHTPLPRDHRNSSPGATIQHKIDSQTTTILLWTPFFTSPNWFIQTEKMFSVDLCPNTNCIFTTNKQKLESSDALVFHCGNPPKAWPSIRYPNQIYSLYCAESPVHAGMSSYNNKINLTASYRLDSDAVTRYYFLKPTVSEPYVPRIPFKDKTGLAVWPATNCNTLSKREQLIAHLRQHMEVDGFGPCGNHVCPKSQSEKCYQQFEKRYKFFLAFENSICNDYVTEKFFNPLNYELVPVVFGGANYSQHAPPHSYINVRDFNSVEELANFLKNLASNEAEYNTYFEWKSQYKVQYHSLDKFYCELCRIASGRNYHKEYRDLQGWWENNQCDNSAIYKYIH